MTNEECGNFVEWWLSLNSERPLQPKVLALMAWQAATLAEREACAQVCDSVANDCPADAKWADTFDYGCFVSAQAIRARGDKEGV